MVAAITTGGYISTRVIPGSFNAAEFCDFITEQVVSAALILIEPVSDLCLSDSGDEPIPWQPKHSHHGQLSDPSQY